MQSELRKLAFLGFLTFALFVTAAPEELQSAGNSFSPSQIQELAESVHETLERENPDLKGIRSLAQRFFSNWNYFRTYVQKMRLAHATDSANPEGSKHILNTSVLLLGTHLSEHVIGHGMHYLSTFSSNPWIYWSGTLVGEAIASPFVEVVCIAGVCVYARSPSFQEAITHFRVSGYRWFVKKWAEPFFSLFFEQSTGLERLEQSLGEGALTQNPLFLPEAIPLIALKMRSLPNGDVLLDSFEAAPHEFSPEDWQRLRQSLKVLGWNIADGIWSSLRHIKHNHFQMLRSEVFVDSLEIDAAGKATVTMKAGALRRTSRPRLKRCAQTILKNSP